MSIDCVEVPSDTRIDIAVLKERGFIGLEKGLRTGRPRFPYCSRPWCPGNRAYLCDLGYYTDASSNGPSKVRIYTSTVRSIFASRFYDMISAGFQHSPLVRRLWPVMWKPIAKLSGYEELSASSSFKLNKLDVVEVDVLVVGGGLAGIEASLTAARMGASVLLVEYRRLGGFMRLLDSGLVDERVRLIRESRGVRVLEGYKYIGVFSEGHIVAGNGSVILVKPKSVVYATGSISPPPLALNNDLPGLVSLDYGLELLSEGYRPKRAVILGGSYWSVRVAKVIADSGVTVSFIPVDGISKEAEELLSGSGIGVEEGRVLGFKGMERVNGVILDDGRVIKGDIVLSGVEEYPDANVVYAIGASSNYCNGRGIIVPQVNKFLEVKPNVFIAGSIIGDQSLDETLTGASLAGVAAASRSGHGDISDVESVAEEYWKLKTYECQGGEVASTVRVWLSGSIEGLQFVDVEAEVTITDLVRAWESGYRSMEKIKRVTGLGTGLEQGRFSAHTAALLLSRIYGASVSDIGLFKSRPPHMLPSFGDLIVGGLE
ncbi:MAG: FAD-dependent oxidoreductase [Desulfurococcales archaeon]|nr:FAD-dependent oxidoreductase [Desulfurococcales archaeon]